jgi:hypothetical protein
MRAPLQLTLKILIPLIASLFIAPVIAQTAAQTPEKPVSTHRYLIERTFPKGALDGLDAATKAKVNQGNATVDVRWLKSYANADKTKTYCVYEGPNEAAVRKAAQINNLPIDSVVEVPVELDPELQPQQSALQPAHRYFVERTFPKGAIDGITPAGKAQVNATNSKFGVKWVTSYANDDKTKTYCIYEGPTADSIREAAKANGMNANTVTEVPVTLLPK